MKKWFKNISAGAKKIAETPFRRFIPTLMLIALILNIVIEALARNSLFGMLSYLFTSPLVFFVNLLIIFLTFCPCLLIGKRIPLLTFTVALWLGIGIGNAVVLSNRATPLSAIDFLVLKSAFTMLPIYFNIIQIILMLGLIALAVAFVVLLFIKFPCSKVVWHKSAACIGLAFVAIWVGSTIIHADMNKTEKSDEELSVTYEKYGFAYCFSQSLFVHGVDKPTDYTSDKVNEIIDTITADGQPETDIRTKPNIIFVQLESFFDPNHVIGVEYSTDPTPNFNRLKEEGVSGYLGMANVGGGTANTEFEILTGMNLEHFGFGEYPYTTALRDRACESIAANLKRIGYSTHAMHNHIADFYDRDSVYANLGFDTFTPIEMMRNIVKNPLGWAKDEMLTGEIISALDSTDSRDFVFAVSVQAHGKYPDEEIENNGVADDGYEDLGVVSDEGQHAVKVSGIADEGVHNQFTYYVNQVYEMDLFVGELTEQLKERDEECIVVFYGDHMPALPLTDGDVTNGDIYETEYVIWSNYLFAELSEGEDLNCFDRDMEAYALSAYVQKLCGISIGNITKLHQSDLLNEEDKDECLRILEYSQLYDEDSGEYTPTDMKWGTREIVLSSYQMSGNTLYVRGEGFNEYSTVIVDGIKRSTSCINEHTLAVENVFFSVDSVEVVQSAAGIGDIYRAVMEQ